jgi:ribosome-associated protein
MNERIEKIKDILESKKANDVESFDLSENDYFVDYVVIATTLNNKHAYALLNYLKTDLKPAGETFLNIEESDDWTVIDLGNMMIHLMSQEYRNLYKIEDFLKKFNRNTKEVVN